MVILLWLICDQMLTWQQEMVSRPESTNTKTGAHAHQGHCIKVRRSTFKRNDPLKNCIVFFCYVQTAPTSQNKTAFPSAELHRDISFLTISHTETIMGAFPKDTSAIKRPDWRFTLDCSLLAPMICGSPFAHTCTI